MTLSLGTGVMPVKDTALPDIPTKSDNKTWGYIMMYYSGKFNILMTMLCNEVALFITQFFKKSNV